MPQPHMCNPLNEAQRSKDGSPSENVLFCRFCDFEAQSLSSMPHEQLLTAEWVQRRPDGVC